MYPLLLPGSPAGYTLFYKAEAPQTLIGPHQPWLLPSTSAALTCHMRMPLAHATCTCARAHVHVYVPGHTCNLHMHMHMTVHPDGDRTDVTPGWHPHPPLRAAAT